MKVIQSTILILLLMLLGFCAGMYAGSFFISTESGFTGSAVAFWYGIAGLIAGLITGIVFIHKLRGTRLRNVLIVVVILSLVVCGWIIYRVKVSSANKPGEKKSNFVSHAVVLYEQDVQLPAGIGIAKPHLTPETPLYFYSHIPFGATPDQLKPTDSITFMKGEHYIEIATAPPWLVPEVLKLDYNIFFLRTITISKDWLEVIVNNKTGQTAWIDANAAEFIDWQRFLIDITSIAVLEPANNPVRLKPLDHASILAESPPHFEMRPLAVKGDWLMVSTLGLADRIEPTGWIRWRDDNRLLISFSPLS